MAEKFLIETFGCQMNVHDSERMAGLLEAAGMEAAADERDADLILINTCSVRERAEDKLFSRLGELAQLRSLTGRPTVAVAGCVAQQEGARLLSRAPVIDVIVGTQAIKQLPDLLARARQGGRALDVGAYDDVSFPLGVARRHDPVKAYVTIIEGCNDYCAFCIVPYTRGHERMRPAGDIVEEVREAAASGHREIQLLGQIVNHYQAPDDPSCDFAGLLARIDAVDGVERIRFASPHPRHVSARLIAAYRDLARVCPHLHLPVQSGSTRVLQRMRRRHSREEYLELVGRLRESVPGIALSTDVIVGFPGETDADFEDTLSLARAVRYHSMFSFKYSPRPGTLATRRMPDDVSEAEKTHRIVSLQDAQRAIQLEINKTMEGERVEVLVDSVSRRRSEEVAGRTPHNTVVNLPGGPELVGRTVAVRVERAGPHSLWGRPDERGARAPA